MTKKTRPRKRSTFEAKDLFFGGSFETSTPGILKNILGTLKVSENMCEWLSRRQV